jgi:NADH-ubiquinone oxidoreductase chain 5
MYLLIIFLPLLSAFISGILGRKIGIKGSQLLSCTLLVLTSILVSIAFFEVGFNESSVSILLFSWIDSEFLKIDWGFLWDSLTISMLLPVLWVSTLVHLYSIGYMEGDPHVQRFFSYLSLFTFFMIILVTGENFLIVFVGWEGVGICSYLLINFWFRRLQANKAAIQAIIMNRIGDWGFSIALFIMFWLFGNIDYYTVFSLASMVNSDIVTIIMLAFLLAAMGKSAQIGLHTWLPNAMEGPTPVSALIHAATMVTAGVYLLLRTSPILEQSSTALLAVSCIGAITSLFAATVGLVQNDLKKVIAYSTCSQLGMMVLACGLSSYNVALFHLVNHAFFKALLFLSAGAIIHALNSEQDFRKMGGLRFLLPFTYTMMLIGSLSLMAMPFLTGFYSKDLIIELASGQFTYIGTITYWLATISATFTSIYSFRLINLTFFGYPNGNKNTYELIHEISLIMGMPLIILAIFSIFFGYLTRDIFVGIGSSFLANSLFIHPDHVSYIEAEFALPLFYKLLPLIGSIVGSFFIFILYQYYPNLLTKIIFKKPIINIYKFLNKKYNIDDIYFYILKLSLNFGYISNKIFDRGALEIIGPYGLVKIIKNTSIKLTSFDSGFIPSYALYIFIGLISLLLIAFSDFDSKFLLLFLWTIFFYSLQISTSSFLIDAEKKTFYFPFFY